MKHNYSSTWKKRGDRTGLIRNTLLKSMSYKDSDIENPIVGIINTWTAPPDTFISGSCRRPSSKVYGQQVKRERYVDK